MTTTPTTGSTFVALQVHDPEAAARFLEEHLGLHRAEIAPPGDVVFDTHPIPLAVRAPSPGVDPATAAPHPGHGIALWLATEDTDALHERLLAAGVPVLQPPRDSPFGRMLVLEGPEDYRLTVHDGADR